MIGALIGVMYAVITVGIWCYGAYYIQAHYAELKKSNYDMFRPWNLVIFGGLFWPVAVPMYLAHTVGVEHRERQKATESVQKAADAVQKLAAARARSLDKGPR